MSDPGRIQELQTLAEIGQSITAHLDLQVVLPRVAQAAVTLTGADESYLLLLDAADGHLYLRAEANLGAEEAKNFRIKSTDSIAGLVLHSGQPVRMSRATGKLKVKTGITAYALVNVPMTVGQAVIGVLGINNRQQQREFSADDEKLLSLLADWAAIAIQNAQLFDATREFNRDLQLVNEVSRLVSGTLDAQQIPRVLLQRTAEIIGAECGSLARVNKERGGIVFELAYNSNGRELKRLMGLVMPLNEGIVGEVARTGQPVLTNDVHRHPAWSPLADRLTGFETRKLLAVPLLGKGEVMGVIELLNKKEGDFVETDLTLLSLVAASAATAIENAEQYAELRRAIRALDEAQAQRIAAERWAVLGKAAATLAHRINNSTALVPIAAQHTRSLLAQVDLPPEVRDTVAGNLDRIERNSLYTVDLASVLLRRFRKNPSQAQDINALIRQALDVVEIPPEIRIVRHLDPDLPPVITSDLLVDVFVELISNAVRALSGRPAGLVRLATFKSGPEHISCQISDNGPGIPPENAEKIFDMFFTTTENGLGFGLWWVKTFLEQQRGDISVDSVPGRQTTFTITLPRTAAQPAD